MEEQDYRTTYDLEDHNWWFVGMRRISLAMLGRPEVLFLDEPTNGLDPPQIAAMRPMLQSYAASGRTVVVSSHLLAEVELTCTHVVVMNAGRVVTAGPVADLLSSEDTTAFGRLEETTGADQDAVLRALRAAAPAPLLVRLAEEAGPEAPDLARLLRHAARDA